MNAKRNVSVQVSNITTNPQRVGAPSHVVGTAVHLPRMQTRSRQSLRRIGAAGGLPARSKGELVLPGPRRAGSEGGECR